MAHTSRKNAALVQGLLTDVIAGGDVAAAGVFLAEDVVTHNLVFGGRRGRQAVTAFGWRLLAAADVDIDVTDVVATEDRVAVQGTVTGTHHESLMDLAPTGASFEIVSVWFCRIEDGRIAEIWSLPDGLGLLRQLGASPELPSSLSLTKPNTNDYETHDS